MTSVIVFIKTYSLNLPQSQKRSGGDNGRAVVVGKPDESLLLKRITDADDTLRMPPSVKQKNPRRPPSWVEQI